MLDFFLLARQFDSLAFDPQTNSAEQAHVYIGDPDQRKTGNHVAAPIVKQELIASDGQERRGDVMAQAVFTRKDEKEFSLVHPPAGMALVGAALPEFTKRLFLRDRPRNRSDRNGENKQFDDLIAHGVVSVLGILLLNNTMSRVKRDTWGKRGNLLRGNAYRVAE